MYTSIDRSQPSSNEDTPLIPPLEPPGLDRNTLDEISNYIMSIPEMADMDDCLPENSLPPEPAVTPSGFENEVQQWHQFLIQAAQSIAPSYEGSLAYACGLAAGLHLATTSAVIPHPMRLQARAEELFTAMKDLPDEALDAFEMLHVRM